VDWQVVWWFGGLYALVVTALFLIFVGRTPAHTHTAPAGSSALPVQTASAMRVLRNREVWLLSLAFGLFVMANIALGTYLPTYLSTVHGMPLSQAALLSSVTSLISIFSCPAGGILSDRIGSRKRPYLLGMVLVAVTMPLIAFIGPSALFILVIFQGLFGGLVPTNIFSASVEVVGDERLGGMAMGVIMVGQNAGMLLGPMILGALAESVGWPVAFGSLAVMCLAGALAGWLARTR
jgi:MFS family permease